MSYHFLIPKKNVAILIYKLVLYIIHEI